MWISLATAGTGPKAAGTTSDRHRLDQSLAQFTRSNGYNLDELRADLARFAFLLGGDPQHFIEP